MNAPTAVAPEVGLAQLCAAHLRHELELLAAALPLVRAVQEGFNLPDFAAFMPALASHGEFARLLHEIEVRRQWFREAAASHVHLPAREVTLTRVLASLPADDQVDLAAEAERLRQLAEEVAGINYRVSVHLRVHLGAYRRILRDLTNTSVGSGRYGPAGKSESLDYRPLIHIHG